MTSRLLLGAVLLGACGGTLYTTQTATPAAAPADAIDCVRSKLREIHYDQVAFDEAQYRVVARRVDYSAHRADIQFRRMIYRLDVDATPSADGKTELKVVGHTLAEYETHRGPTQVEERASADVNQAAQTLIQACGQA